ncbi:hypothetical protein Gpo141_00010291 [Globisporangium polare]
MDYDNLLVDSWPHKGAIFVFNALVIAESALMLSRSTNPFFGTMTQPTPAFIAFMLLQISFLGGSLLLGCGTCVSRIRFVQANRGLFIVNALNYAVYAGVFFIVDANTEHGLLASGAVAAALLGAWLCRAYEKILVVNYMGEKLPTESPSFAHHKLQAVNA